MRVSGVKRQTRHIDVKGKLDGARPEKMQIDLKPRAHLGMHPPAKGLGFLKGLITGRCCRDSIKTRGIMKAA